jgi:hypothetical protein
MPEVCRLCGRDKPLQDSHIVPAFVYKWLKETSATGFLRFGREPNRRVQDGHKRRWLCLDCEQRLSSWETQFASRFFHPINEDGAAKILYGDWMLKFCTSVSWRTLLMMKENGWLTNFTEPQRKAAGEAMSHWKQFILDHVPHPDRFEQHMIVFDAIESASAGNLPANMNRYILRTVDLDAVRSDSTALILSKLGKIIILGFIDVTYPKQWMGTKIHVRSGRIGDAKITVPKQLFDYLIEEAKGFAAIHTRISDTQQARMDETMWKNLDRVGKSKSTGGHDV